MAQRYYVLQWQTDRMSAPAFNYYVSKRRRDKDYREMKARGTWVKKRSGIVNHRNASLVAALEHDRQRHPDEEEHDC